jgi:peptidoglycan-associated lipoprotein
MKGHAVRASLLTSSLALASVLLTGCPKTPVVVPEASTGGTSAAGQQAAPSRSPGSPSSTAYVATTALGNLHFDVNRAAILPAEQTVLDSNVGWIKSNGDVHLMLEGFADERGTPAHNRALGERRAAAVRDALVAQGIEASRISIRSYGESHPLCTERTDDCWAKNRRVQFLVKQ